MNADLTCHIAVLCCPGVLAYWTRELGCAR